MVVLYNNPLIQIYSNPLHSIGHLLPAISHNFPPFEFRTSTLLPAISCTGSSRQDETKDKDDERRRSLQPDGYYNTPILALFNKLATWY